MASIFRGGPLVFLLIILVISSSSHTIATARSPYNRVRQLATDCNSAKQGDVAGCGGGSSGGSAPAKPKPKSCGSAPGASRCKKGCCGKNKFGDVICC